MSYELPQEALADVSDDVKALVTKPEVLAIIEKVVNPLVTHKQTLLTEKKTLENQLKDLGGLETVKSQLARLTELETMSEEDKRKAANANKDIESVRTEFSTKLSAREKELNDLREAIAQREVNSLIGEAFKDAEDVELVLPFVKSRVKHTIDASGKVSIEVLKADGTPMFGKNADHASLADLAEEFKNSPKFAKLFKADNKSGGGTSSTTGPGLAANPFAKNTPHWNVTAQSQLYRSNPTLAKTLAAAAGIVLK